MKYLIIATLALTTLAATSFACEMEDGKPCVMHMSNKMEHGDHDKAHAMHTSGNASTQAYQAGMAKMHQGMDITYTGDSDIDFLRGMIPHHQGAVDMAQTVLEYGQDPQVRRMAKDVIRAQNAEIAWMTKWLAQLEAKGIKVSSNTPRQAGKTDKAWAGHTWMNER